MLSASDRRQGKIWGRIVNLVLAILFPITMLIFLFYIVPAPENRSVKALPLQQTAATESIIYPTVPALSIDGVIQAWGDVDGDGDLDAAVDKATALAIFLNTDGALEAEPAWVADERYLMTAWGDIDGDGDLDVAAGISGTNKIIFNQNGMLTMDGAQEFGTPDWTTRVSWGDVNGDGWLDLMVGNRNQSNKLYLNDGNGRLTTTPAWIEPGVASNTSAIEWADIDQDGDLDLAVGERDYNGTRIYKNQLVENQGNWQLVLQPGQFSGCPTQDLAWGDMNGDNFPELAVVDNCVGPHRVYANNGGLLGNSPYYIGNGLAFKVTWGDINNDGFEDLAVGTGSDVPHQVFLSNGTMLPATPSWQSDAYSEAGPTALADINNDGKLDLSVSYGLSRPVNIYFNQLPSLATNADSTWNQQLTFNENTSSVAWGDIDKDGDLDLVTGNYYDCISWRSIGGCQGYGGGVNRLFLNHNGTLTPIQDWMPVDRTNSIALGDMNNDGWLDIAVGKDTGCIDRSQSPCIRDNGHDLVYLNDGNGRFQEAFSWSDNLTNTTTSVAWGDMNGDGWLDLAVGNAGRPNLVYLNQNGTLTANADWSDEIDDNTQQVAWGDVDNDGDLDLAVANQNDPNKVYLNEQGVLSADPVWQDGRDDSTRSIAWGDVDGDGDLDLAVGNNNMTNRLYLNENGRLQTEPVWNSLDDGRTRSIAWGDVDGDGDLDLIAGNSGGRQAGFLTPTRLYLNINGTLQTATESFWNLEKHSRVHSIALGDVDGDGDLDLATGNEPIDNNLDKDYQNADGANRIFLNERVTSISQANVVLSVTRTSDGTGLFAPANGYAVPDIHSGQFISIPYTLHHAQSVPAYGVQGFYSLNGGDDWLPAIASSTTQTANLTTGSIGEKNASNSHVYEWDVYHSGFFGQSDNVVFRLEAYFTAAHTQTVQPVGTYPYTNQAPGDLQEGFVSSHSYPFRVRGNQIQVISSTNGIPVQDALVYHLPTPQQLGGDPIADIRNVPFTTDELGYLQGRGQLQSGDQLVAMLPVAYGGDGVDALKFDGQNDIVDFGHVTTTETLVNDLTVSAWVRLDKTEGIQRIVSHDRTNSNDGIGFGIKNGGLRFTTYHIKDYDSKTISLLPDRWYHVAAVMNANNEVSFYVDGVFQEKITHYRPGLADTQDKLLLGAINPTGGQNFSGIMNEVRIWSTARTEAQLQAEISQSLPDEDLQYLAAYWPIVEGSGDTIADYSTYNFTGKLGDGDESRSPIWVMETPQEPTYVVYHTSATPTETGLTMTAVPPDLGIIPITIYPTKTLTLFDLDVSLEWDARRDTSYLDQLEQDLYRTSQILFDLSNGQAALGDIRVFHDKGNWFDSDVVIYASNSHRPNANLGGITHISRTEQLKDGSEIAAAYLPGQIRMGATWNRFGNSSGNLGEDWPRALAHEMGHYAFFLLDNYLGIDENGLLGEVNCQGSIMTDAYISSEYLSRAPWEAYCLNTLAEKTTGRADWETVTTFYPWITESRVLTGPSNLPLNLTQLSFANVAARSNTLQAPFFGLLDASGGPLVFGEGEAQAYLYKMDEGGTVPEDILALGTPNRDLVQARGVEPGDELCVYGRSWTMIGCHRIGEQEQPFNVYPVTNWQPDIEVTPETTMTIRITLTNSTPLISATLQFFPYLGDAIQWTEMTAVPNSNGQQFTQIISLATPTPGGLVRVRGYDADSISKEVLSQFYLGSGWNINKPGLNVNRPGLNVNRPGLNVNKPGLNVNRPGLNAPIASSDGQVIIFSLDNLFEDVVSYTLQSLVTLPTLDSWLTPVGQAYRFTTGTDDLPNSSITFYYLQKDVPAGYENAMRIYYQPSGETKWQPLATNWDDYRNMASAPLPGEGIYMLAATIETPRLRQGWNLFAYPNTDERSVNKALASIYDDITSVYAWTVTSETLESEWLLYDTTVLTEFEPLVNDLPSLEPLHPYWIYAITDTTPYIGVPTGQAIMGRGGALPPATYYGRIAATETLTPEVDMPIVAYINGIDCGQSRIEEQADLGLVFKIQIRADSGDGCGTDARAITFQVGDVTLPNVLLWNNTQAHYLELEAITPPSSLGFDTYLPLITNSLADVPDLPDLIVIDVKATPDSVQITIKNQGTAVVDSGFWVDLYINPDPPPEKVNDIWQFLGDEGVAWSVTDAGLPIMPGDTIQLALNDGYMVAAQSNLTRNLTGQDFLYVQVDSWNGSQADGAILETHEQADTAYNNILGPIAIDLAQLGKAE